MGKAINFIKNSDSVKLAIVFGFAYATISKIVDFCDEAIANGKNIELDFQNKKLTISNNLILNN